MSARTWENVLRRVGFSLIAVTTLAFGVFVVGETLDDPGGWAAVGLIALWAVPLVVLCLVAWRLPGPALTLLAVLTGLLVLASLWFVLAPGAWRDVENQVGPVRAIAVWVLAAAVAVLGLRRTRPAAVLLLVIALVPLALTGLRHGGSASLAVMALPALITGVLYLLSSSVRPRTRGGGPAQGPVSPPTPARPGR